MVEIESPLGKKTFGQQGRRVLSVSDDSEDFDTKPLPPSMMPQQGQEVKLTPEQFNQMQAKRNEMRMAVKKPTSESKQRIEILTGIGRLTKDIVIEGYKFSLQSLKAREMRDVIRMVSQVETSSDSMYEMRAQILARSLYSIDDQPVGLVLGGDGLDVVAKFIDDSEEYIVNQLFSAYNEMIKLNEDKFSIKDVKEAVEVASEIKK